MHFSLGTLGPSTPWVGVGSSEGCGGGWAGGIMRVWWVGGTWEFCPLTSREYNNYNFFLFYSDNL